MMIENCMIKTYFFYTDFEIGPISLQKSIVLSL